MLILGQSGSTGLTRIDFVVMGVYLLIVLAVGAWFSRSSGDTEKYLLGGRSMGWLVVGISYLVSLLSTISLVAVPGEAYNHGITLMLKSLWGPLFAVVTFFLFIRFYFKSKAFTPFNYLEQRFDPRVRAIASILYWFTRVFYLALVLYASAKVFQGVSDWPVAITILLVGVIGVAYTVMGGLQAVIWTDVIQFVALLIGLGLVFIEAVTVVPGGISGVFSYAFEHGRGMEELAQPEFYGLSPYVRLTLWVMLLSTFGEFLFYNSADQIAIQRLLSTKGYREAKWSLFTFLIVSVPVSVLLWVLGLAIFAYYGQQPADAQPASGDLALFSFIRTQLPAPMPGIIVAAMLAAVMSTLDSGINSLATVATKDFYLRFLKPAASEQAQLRFSKVFTVVIGMFAVVVGLIISQVSNSIGETIIEASTAWMSFGSVLAPVFLLGVTTRSFSGTQAIICMIAGWLVTVPMILWYLVSKYDPDLTPISFMYVGVPGLVVPLVIGYTMTLFSPRQPAHKINDLTLLTLAKPEDK